MIEETKKEVKSIRSVESKARWQMTREERREKIVASMAAQAEIRDWRWKQAQEMKAAEAEKSQEVKNKQLQESKDFVEFKREAKTRTKEEELQFQHEAYVKQKEVSAWEAEQKREEIEQEQELVRERIVNMEHIREVKLNQKEQRKAEEQEERMLEEHLEMAKIAKQLQMEKEKLLQDLNYTKNCQSGRH